MKKYLYILFISTFVTLIAAAETPKQAILQKVVDKLDVTSFSNSIGLRREKGKVTLKDYGVTEVKFDGERATASEPNNSWHFVITLLNNKLDQIKICFEDQARNGGSYHAQDAYLLTENKIGFLQASPTKDARCRCAS